MRFVAVCPDGGSTSGSLLTALLTRELSVLGSTIVLSLRPRESACDMRILEFFPDNAPRHRREARRWLEAGAEAVLLVTASRVEIRRAVAAGVRRARRLRAAYLIVDAVAAAELGRVVDTWTADAQGSWQQTAPRRPEKPPRCTGGADETAVSHS